jgi:plastocyanin
MAGLIPSRRLAAVALALIAALAAALLLSQGRPASAASGHTLKLAADAKGKLKFTKSRLTTTRGKVTLVMTNPRGSGIPHAIAVEGKGIDKDGRTAAPGRTSRVSVNLKKGTYEFYCPVDGHKAAGMEGKLVVR